ncbi:MAG TPA: glycerophosphodiester phosphodiesterase family protein [Afifellaceae bacterium]|nr:glycerophosphodiester phosphodiesterase family protein [Afifellaceae bacterium]
MFRRDRLRWLTARPIAHRGLHDLARGRPENSLAAFEAAVEGRYAIECDLHPAGDGVPVVFHDDDLYRLTGEEGGVRDRAAVELGKLRLAGTQEWVPTLEQLLAAVEGRVPLLIELKHMAGRDQGFAAAVVEALRRYDGPVALMSFDAALVADVKAAAPELPRGLTAGGDWRKGGEQFRAIRTLEADFISYSIDDLPTWAPVVANRILGIPLICWTVRNPAQLAKAKAWTDQITFEGFLP